MVVVIATISIHQITHIIPPEPTLALLVRTKQSRHCFVLQTCPKMSCRMVAMTCYRAPSQLKTMSMSLQASHQIRLNAGLMGVFKKPA